MEEAWSPRSIGLGGWHLGLERVEKLSFQIIRTASDRGITFLDHSWDYNDGATHRAEPGVAGRRTAAASASDAIIGTQEV
jgi:aryl-alcohol dehydrogenase-like predicted oxidoreductase